VEPFRPYADLAAEHGGAEAERRQRELLRVRAALEALRGRMFRDIDALCKLFPRPGLGLGATLDLSGLAEHYHRVLPPPPWVATLKRQGVVEAAFAAEDAAAVQAELAAAAAQEVAVADAQALGGGVPIPAMQLPIDPRRRRQQQPQPQPPSDPRLARRQQHQQRQPQPQQQQRAEQPEADGDEVLRRAFSGAFPVATARQPGPQRRQQPAAGRADNSAARKRERERDAEAETATAAGNPPAAVPPPPSRRVEAVVDGTVVGVGVHAQANEAQKLAAVQGLASVQHAAAPHAAAPDGGPRPVTASTALSSLRKHFPQATNSLQFNHLGGPGEGGRAGTHVELVINDGEFVVRGEGRFETKAKQQCALKVLRQLDYAVEGIVE
jgi:hypothetical protein